jgi:uncharacterized surface protein with fasciclin (FAS1) repeats
MKFLMQLGKQQFRFVLLATALATAGLSACKKDVENTAPVVAPSPSLVDVISSNPNYSILSAAIQKTNLTALLSSKVEFTILAPNNTAFATLAAPYNSATTINALNPSVTTDAAQITALQNILLYHVISFKNKVADLPSGGVTSQRTPVTTARRDNAVFFPRIGGTVLINSVTPIVQPDLEAANGYIHGISQILVQPTATFYGVISAAASSTATPQFTLLKQAIDRQNTQALVQNPPTTPVLSFLNTDQSVPLSNGRVVNYTFFAPTDAALQAYLTAQGYASISAVPFATLTALLQRHLVTNGRVFNNELTSGRQFTNALGNTLTLGGAASAFTITNTATGVTANVSPNGSFASNGTFYTIDRVL